MLFAYAAVDCTLQVCPVCIEGAEAERAPGQCCPDCLGCPIEGQIFTDCASVCPHTCTSLRRSPPVQCLTVCRRGCACPSGKVIDEVNNRCVLPEDCPKTCRFITIIYIVHVAA